MITDPWVVFSYEHLSWWKPDRNGYTANVLEAGVYTKDEAHEIEKNAEPGNELALSLAIVLDVAGETLPDKAHFTSVRSVGHQLSILVRNLS